MVTMPGSYTISIPEKGACHLKAYPAYPTAVLDFPEAAPGQGRPRRQGKKQKQKTQNVTSPRRSLLIALYHGPVLTAVPAAIIPLPAFSKDFYLFGPLPGSATELKGSITK